MWSFVKSKNTIEDTIVALTTSVDRLEQFKEIISTVEDVNTLLINDEPLIFFLLNSIHDRKRIHSEFAMHLIQNTNLDINLKFIGCSILQTAIKSSHNQVVLALLNRPELDVNYNFNDSFSHAATLVRNRHFSGRIITAFLNHPAISDHSIRAALLPIADYLPTSFTNYATTFNINYSESPSKFQGVFEYLASYNPNLAIELWEKYPEINTTIQNQSLLLMVCLQKHWVLAQRLLQCPSVDVNFKSEGTRTISPLTWLIDQGHLEFAGALLKHPEINVDLRDKEGNTPLILALKRGHLGMAKDLIAAKANLALSNKADETAYNIAKKENYEEILVLLGDVGPERRDMNQIVQLIKACLEKPESLNDRTAVGNLLFQMSFLVLHNHKGKGGNPLTEDQKKHFDAASYFLRACAADMGHPEAEGIINNFKAIHSNSAFFDFAKSVVESQQPELTPQQNAMK